jgi:hypothetical protein
MRSTWNFPFSHVPPNQVGRGKSVQKIISAGGPEPF